MINLDTKSWKYIGLLFLICFIIQSFVVYNGGEDYELFTPIIGVMMFLPAIGALFLLYRSKEGIKYIDWGVKKPLYLLLGLTIPAIITLLSVTLFESLGWGTNKYYSIQGSEVSIAKELFILGNENQNIFFFVLNFLLTGIVYSLITSIMTFGEEIGWRGYLQKKLLERNSVIKSLIFLGFIWGVWHFPLIISGYNYPEFPVLGAFLLFPLTTIFGSFLLGWLTINGKSVWPAVFAHGGVNSIMTVLDSMDFSPNKLLANFIILVVWLVVAVISYQLIKKDNHEKTVQQPI